MIIDKIAYSGKFQIYKKINGKYTEEPLSNIFDNFDLAIAEHIKRMDSGELSKDNSYVFQVKDTEKWGIWFGGAPGEANLYFDMKFDTCELAEQYAKENKLEIELVNKNGEEWY